ncbi:MAG: hypothetical protein HFG22_10830 [Lachnospiraceae bacterium]|nr:hypothetical protein [Lachnospiraceae bacterium]
MLWYKDLYVGERAAKKRASIIRMMRSGKVSAAAYAILPAANEKNLLDILQASQLCGEQGALRRRLTGTEPLILGIAWSYEDALRLAGRMVDEVYRATGAFDLRAYLGLESYLGEKGCPGEDGCGRAAWQTGQAADDAEVVG